MKDNDEQKHEAVSLRLTRTVFRELEKSRVDQTRTRSGQITHYVIKGLLADGYKPLEER